MRSSTGRWRGSHSRSETIPPEKPPSVSEMIDFANALQLLGTEHVTEEHRDVLLPFLAKTEKDRRHLLLREGFKSLLDDGALSLHAYNTRPSSALALNSRFYQCLSSNADPLSGRAKKLGTDRPWQL